MRTQRQTEINTSNLISCMLWVRVCLFQHDGLALINHQICWKIYLIIDNYKLSRAVKEKYRIPLSFLESERAPTIIFLMHFLVISSHARMRLKRPIWSLWGAICMFLKSPIGKLNEHTNVPRDCLPGKENMLFMLEYTSERCHKSDWIAVVQSFIKASFVWVG